MSSVLSTISTFWVTYGPWIGVALVPTIITGLSLSPKTAAEIPKVQKIWEYIKQVMGLFSVATPKDAPGTFQLPLKLSRLKKKNVPPAAILILVFLATNSGCSWFKSEAKKAEDIAFNCLEKGLADKAADLIPVVIAAASGGNFLQVIEAFGKEFGIDVAACAANGAKNSLIASMPAGGAVDKNDPTAKKLNNVSAVIQLKKWTFKETK